MRGTQWKRRIELDNDGKPIIVWYRDGLQISQDMMSIDPNHVGIEMVFAIYVDGPKGAPGAYLGEHKTINGAKRLADTMRGHWDAVMDEHTCEGCSLLHGSVGSTPPHKDCTSNLGCRCGAKRLADTKRKEATP